MRIERLTLAVACGIALSAGCARPPSPGEPVDRDEVVKLAKALEVPGPGIAGLRGSGGGEVTVSGRGTTASFAFVYSAPGWIRLDIRPELGAAAHALSSLSILDGQCLATYFPARAVEVTGCLSDLAADVPDVDFAALALGMPSLAFLDELVDARLARLEDALVLTGTLAGRRLELRADGSPATISTLELELTPGGSLLRLSYAGRGWHAVRALPRSVEISVTGGERDVRLRLELTQALALDRVSREEYALEVPPAARRISWADLGLWRKR